MARRKSLPAPGPLKRPPTASEQQRIAEALDRRLERKEPIAVEIKGDELAPPHSDAAGHFLALQQVFGTNSKAFLSANAGALEAATRQRGAGRDISSSGLNAGLALMQAIGPVDELEAALAIQMAGTHALAVEMLGRAKLTDNTEHVQLYGNLAVKLERTFTAQIEALSRLRGKGQQTVTVEHIHKHVTVQPGAQAIVGDVHHHLPGGTREQAKSGDQSDAPPSDAAVTALPGPDQARDGVPVPGRRRKEAVPDARRHKSGRSKR